MSLELKSTDWLAEPQDQVPSLPASLETIGRLVSGFGDQSTGQYQEPVIDPLEMARGLKVTFRPIPAKTPQMMREFVERLGAAMSDHGVQVLPWEEATYASHYEVAIPLSKRIIKIPARMTHRDIDAVMDVYARPSIWSRMLRSATETVYRVHRRLSGFHRRHRVREILRFVWWAQDHAVKQISDHVRTQVVSISPLEKFLRDPGSDYKAKLAPGLRLLAERLAQLIIGVAPDKLSLLNMNLSDSIYPASELDTFVLKSLIPKLHAPIRPLTKGRFEVGSFDPNQNPYAKQAVDLGLRMGPLGLLPGAISMSRLIRRPSTRDVAEELVNGRSGISFGFVAYAEPPVYQGPVEISADEWEQLQPLREMPATDVRKNEQGRWYLRTTIQGKTVHRQIPDVWIVASRSGAEKNNLNLNRDLTRLGFNGTLQLQIPSGLTWEQADIRPSYDTYVMIALALGTAIFHPHLIKDGAPLVHFHGYPVAEWFRANEGFIGQNNPSVACGTHEAGVYNFTSLWSLANQEPDLSLGAIIEPDHGCNLIAAEVDELLNRLQQGVDSGEVLLGGQNLASLRG